MNITPVILSGGSGTRLWPLSRRATPKQFVALDGGQSLFQQTVIRVGSLPDSSPPVIVGNRMHAELIHDQLQEIGVTPRSMIIEPISRNTGPAVALAAQDLDADELILVLPSDAVISDDEAFRRAIVGGVEPARRGWLVTFGVVPTRAETGYGYIEVGEAHGTWADVSKFVEKPDESTARGYVADGRHLWNAGMFLFSAGRFLEELALHSPEVSYHVSASWRDRNEEIAGIEPGTEFADAPAISIDNAVMELSDRVAVVPMDAGWSDVGSWHSVWEMSADDEIANVTSGVTALLDVSGSYVRAGDRLIAVVGLDDVVVVDTPDALLITTRARSQDVKRLLAELPIDFH